MSFLKEISQDPRHFQILTLSVLAGMQIVWADFGPALSGVGLTLATALLVQLGFSLGLKIPFDFRSPLISGLSLSILLKSGVFWVVPLAAVIAIASKFLFRVDRKHVFNPANIGIVAVLLFLPQYAWISPAQWGSSVWVGFLLVCFAFMVLYRVPSRDMSFMFFGLWSALMFGRAFWLGDPLAIPAHQLQNGAFLIFTFFMISDPKTIPDTRAGRAVFALAVAGFAFILQFEFHLRESLFYALGAACLLRPLLDRLWRARAYQWSDSYFHQERIE